MKNLNKDLIKNIGISLLVVIAVILVVMVISYDKISIGKVIPKVEEYELADEMKQELENEQADENSEIIITYELDATDLKQYEKTKEYNKGKKDPFAEETTSVTSNTTNNLNSTIENTVTNNLENSSSENFYKDDGTK